MRRVVLVALLALGAPAAAQQLRGPPDVPLPPPHESPLAPGLPTPTTHRPEPKDLRPIPFVYRQIEHEKVNRGAVGRTNATRGDIVEQRTGWGNPGLGGNPM